MPLPCLHCYRCRWQQFQESCCQFYMPYLYAMPPNLQGGEKIFFLESTNPSCQRGLRVPALTIIMCYLIPQNSLLVWMQNSRQNTTSCHPPCMKTQPVSMLTSKKKLSTAQLCGAPHCTLVPLSPATNAESRGKGSGTKKKLCCPQSLLLGLFSTLQHAEVVLHSMGKASATSSPGKFSCPLADKNSFQQSVIASPGPTFILHCFCCHQLNFPSLVGTHPITLSKEPPFVCCAYFMSYPSPGSCHLHVDSVRVCTSFGSESMQACRTSQEAVQT